MIRKLQEEIRDVSIRERKEKSKLQKEVENLTRQLAEAEDTRRSELLNA